MKTFIIDIKMFTFIYHELNLNIKIELSNKICAIHNFSLV